MAIKIRPALFFDLGQIVDMQEAHRKESKSYSRLKFKRELCIENMAVALQHQDALILVAHNEDSNRLLGYVWLVKVQPHYTDVFYYAEIYTYILPECRSGRVFVKLLNKCGRISRLAGAEYLEFGSFSSQNFTSTLAKRYRCVGKVFDIPI
jgi:hypothetical protein